MDKNQIVTPFLTFKGNALEAIEYYTSNFKDAKLMYNVPFGEEAQGLAGKVMNACIKIYDLEIMFMDMDPQQCPDFTWANSLLINCSSEEMFMQIFNFLKVDGVVMMGPEKIMDLNLVSWVTDKFNVTWQLVWSDK